ncbi:unnamed protein product [Sphenostylis stenocarpa]|uniref:Uncharacterized protein n=1 Tax=Sphenostylis stenocarpa TaxID=92480 RepID=A0AA86S3G0_9FABA|nr:unnamed protein product [Sphenostylis stenocarpa]
MVLEYMLKLNFKKWRRNKIQKKNDVIKIQVDFEEKAMRKGQKGACAAATLRSRESTHRSLSKGKWHIRWLDLSIGNHNQTTLMPACDVQCSQPLHLPGKTNITQHALI